MVKQSGPYEAQSSIDLHTEVQPEEIARHKYGNRARTGPARLNSRRIGGWHCLVNGCWRITGRYRPVRTKNRQNLAVYPPRDQVLSATFQPAALASCSEQNQRSPFCVRTRARA